MENLFIISEVYRVPYVNFLFKDFFEDIFNFYKFSLLL